jgi:hypothetical protein
MQEYFLILVIVSMVFVTQVLSKTPPESVHYEISSYGIMFDENIYYWHRLRRFFFFNSEGNPSIAIDLYDSIPPRIFLTIHEKDSEQIKQILEQRIQFLTSVPETFLDRTYKQVTGKFTS